MSCLLPLSIGVFDDYHFIHTIQSSADKGIQVNYSTNGDLVISRTSNPADKLVFHPQGSLLKHILFGDRYLLVGEFFDPQMQFQKQNIYLINTAEGHTLSKLLVYDLTMKVNNFMCVSKGGGHVYHMYWEDINQKAYSIGFRRSDTGLAICPPGAPISELQLSGGLRIRAEFDGTRLKMLTNRPITGLPVSCPLPLGKCMVTQVEAFGDAIIGSGVPIEQQTSVGHFLLKNTGSNCLRVNSISNSAHFTVKNPILFPIVLDPNQQRDVFVKFDPHGHTGNYIEHLAIQFEGAVEAGSTTSIFCSAKARYPVADATVAPHTE